MNEYIIYTTAGFTESPTSEEVDNCQVLGRVNAADKDSAIDVLYEENKWIEELGFARDEGETIVEQLITPAQRKDIITVINYLLKDDGHHFEEEEHPVPDHIFNTVVRLKKFVEG